MSVASATAERVASAWLWRRALARALFGALLVIGAAWVVSGAFWVYLDMHHFSPFGDARWYADAMWRLVTERPLYDPQLLEPHVIDLTYRYNLPPSLAVVAPIFAMPAGPLLWGWLMGASLGIGLAAVFPRLRAPWALVLLVGIASWWPVHAMVVWANANALVLLLLALALRFPRHAGWAIGGAAAVKFVPILMLAWLIGRRAWGQVVVALAVPLVLTGIVAAFEGPRVFTDFLAVRLNEVSLDGGEQWGLVPMGFLPVVGYVVGGLLAVAAAWRASFTLAAASMLVAIPDLHLHYWTWLLVPMLGVLPRRLAGTARRAEDAGPNDGWALSVRQLGAVALATAVVVGSATAAWLFDASQPAVSSGPIDVRLAGGADGPSRYIWLEEGRYSLTVAPGAGRLCYVSAWLRSRHELTYAAYLGGGVVHGREGWNREVGVTTGQYFVDVHSAGCGWTVSIRDAG